VIDVANLTKHYGPKRILEDVSFTIDRGDRIALVGANGAGKSTLIRMLSGLEPATSGDIKLGHNVLADYFAQDQYKVLDPAAKMLDDISSIAPKVSQVDLRSLLGCFMFSGDDVFKPLGVLSGGERNRYAMAKMLVSPANMLLLDEPTNHLDLRAKDVLLDAIRNFSGTVLFVSHDRYFIDGLATRVFEVEDRRVHIYPGNYEDYLWRKQGGPEKVAASLTESSVVSPAPVAAPILVEEPPKTSVKRLNPIKLRQLEDRLRFTEDEIPRIETLIAAAEEKLGVFTTAEDAQRTAAELEKLRADRAALLTEWEELALMVEEQSLA
jgi:ATP-binding cassette subfamily F protein 3